MGIGEILAVPFPSPTRPCGPRRFHTPGAQAPDDSDPYAGPSLRRLRRGWKEGKRRRRERAGLKRLACYSLL